MANAIYTYKMYNFEKALAYYGILTKLKIASSFNI